VEGVTRFEGQNSKIRFIITVEVCRAHNNGGEILTNFALKVLRIIHKAKTLTDKKMQKSGL
jgi:hypothetical protein